MNRKTVVCGLLICLLGLGCGHEHSWMNATCTEAMVCEICGTTSGAPLGHKYGEASCLSPKICHECGETDGVFEHEFSYATCESPSKCKNCGLEKDKKLGHGTTFGLCVRCGVYQKKDIADQVFGIVGANYERYTQLHEYIFDRLDSMDYSEDNYQKVLKEVEPEYKEMIVSFEEAVRLCGDIELLSGLKDDILSVINHTEYFVNNSTMGTDEFFEKTDEYIDAMAEMRLEELDVIEKTAYIFDE